MGNTRKLLREIGLNGNLIVDDQYGVFIRSTNASFWDSSFEVIGATPIGADNDHNPCVLSIMRPNQGGLFIDGTEYPGTCMEIHFCGPLEYRGCLDWFETMGKMAAEIKKRSLSYESN